MLNVIWITNVMSHTWMLLSFSFFIVIHIWYSKPPKIWPITTQSNIRNSYFFSKTRYTFYFYSLTKGICNQHFYTLTRLYLSCKAWSDIPYYIYAVANRTLVYLIISILYISFCLKSNNYVYIRTFDLIWCHN